MSIVAPEKPRATATHARRPGESRNPAPFPRYPKYKGSGVEWLGEVPAHWEIKPIKAVASCNDDVLPESTDPTDEIVYVEISGVSPDKGITEAQTLAFGAAPSRARRRVRNGDVLVSTVRTYLRAIAPLSDPPENMIASTGFAVIRPRAVNSAFLGYLFRSEFLVVSIIARSVGVSYPAINASDLMRLSIPVPRVDEQSAIVAFLDRETVKIDALIAEQENLIALLKKKRQALISHAVTKGLDPNAPMKDSGIEWLGQIPAHWGVLPIWLLFELGRGRVISHEEIAAHEGPFPVYSSQTENDGEMGNIDTYDFEGDYLTWTTDGANAGTVFRRSGRFNCTNVCGTLKAKSPEIDLGYMVCALGVSTNAFVRLDINPKLMNNVMASIRVPVPPQSEQHAVSAVVAERTVGLDELMQEATRAIALLKERRAALISTAVTGKIDVRAQASSSARAS
ncbi:MAG: restriction endonuclease subunit S [Acidobacteria bacterium]|nr:restriction endonuclease subunit S [Acidobacteriota bacterium]